MASITHDQHIIVNRAAKAFSNAQAFGHEVQVQKLEWSAQLFGMGQAEARLFAETYVDSTEFIALVEKYCRLGRRPN